MMDRKQHGGGGVSEKDSTSQRMPVMLGGNCQFRGSVSRCQSLKSSAEAATGRCKHQAQRLTATERGTSRYRSCSTGTASALIAPGSARVPRAKSLYPPVPVRFEGRVSMAAKPKTKPTVGAACGASEPGAGKLGGSLALSDLSLDCY